MDHTPDSAWHKSAQLGLQTNSLPFSPSCCGSHLHNPYWEWPWHMLFPRPSLGNAGTSWTVKRKCLLCPLYETKKLRLRHACGHRESQCQRLGFHFQGSDQETKRSFLQDRTSPYCLSVAFLTHNSELFFT